MTPSELTDKIAAKYGADFAARLMSHVTVTDGCWTWSGARGGELKRPCFRIGAKTVYVARLILSVKLGRAVRRDRVACHSCDVGLCIHPEHLSEGTPSRNLLEAWRRGRRSRPKSFTEVDN